MPPLFLTAGAPGFMRATDITRSRAFRGRQTDEEDTMSQISLTFPDGNSRDYPAGITAAEVAELEVLGTLGAMERLTQHVWCEL